MKSIRNKILTIMLMLLTILSMIGGSIAIFDAPANAEPNTISGTCHVELSKYSTPLSGLPTIFKVTMPDGEILKGYCIDHGKSVQIDGSYKFTGTLNSNGTYDIIVNTGGLIPWERIHPIAQRDTLPRSKGKSQECQRVGKFTWAPKGKVKLIKLVSDNKILANECKKMYSLAGAEYTVYDSSKKISGKLVTKEDGSTNELSLIAGQYTVKETKSPKGYTLDPKIYTVNIKSNETATIESEDSPVFDPISIVLRKVSDGKSYLNPNADMSDAEFEIKFYDTLEDNVAGLNPTRKWKLKTIKDERTNKYTANLRKAFVLDGSDEFFITEKGEIVLPRGSITIQETKPPKGYKLDPKPYIYKIDTDREDLSVQLNFGNTPEQPNNPLTPSIKTTAVNESTRDNVGEYGKKIKIIDKVSYKELSEGEKYTVKGKLMDKKTCKALKDKDGKEITAKKTFTVTKDNSIITGDGASGTVDLEYEVDSTILKGKTTVVFEKLYYNEKAIADHEDINDEGQSIHFTEIRTTAKSKKSGTNIGNPSKEETIIDVVKYENLIAGKEYTVKGKLMDKDTREAIKDKDGKEITGEKTFTPDKSEGEVEIEFTYDSSLREGEETVVFEKLIHNEKTVAVHADIEDKGQTIVYPKVGTVLAEIDGKKIVKASKDTRLIDIVNYENLIEGEEYTIKGELVLKESGKPLVQDGKKVEAMAKFRAKSTKGTANVIFTLDSTKLDNKEIVAYETVYNEKDEKVVKHSDINNEEQTVKVEIPPKTGDISSANKLLLAIFILGCLELVLIIRIKNRTSVRFFD